MLEVSATFPRRLKMYRVAMGLTMQQVADRIGVTRQTVNQWELGKNEPALENLRAMAKVFDVTVSHLIGEIGFLETETLPHEPTTECNHAGNA